MIFKLVEKLEDDNLASVNTDTSEEKETLDTSTNKDNNIKNKKDPKQIIMDIKKKTNAEFIES